MIDTGPNWTDPPLPSCNAEQYYRLLKDGFFKVNGVVDHATYPQETYGCLVDPTRFQPPMGPDLLYSLDWLIIFAVALAFVLRYAVRSEHRLTTTKGNPDASDQEHQDHRQGSEPREVH